MPTMRRGLGLTWSDLAETAVLWALFGLLSSGVAPDVNEVHYLSKAKHFWNPAWCAGDFFLNSADAHWVFYGIFGWSTLILPLWGVAYVGRALATLHMAWAWRQLSLAVIPTRGASVVAAALAATGLAWGNLSGEWVWGGLEAKSFAFPWVALGLASVARNRWRSVWPQLGIATAWHPLVGGWVFLTVGALWWWRRGGTEDGAGRHEWTWLLVGGLLASVGVLPALALTSHEAPDVRQQAAEIYVYQRLSHHLLPSAFGPTAWLRFLMLVAVWLGIAGRYRTRDDAMSRLHLVVASALGVALLGCLLYLATQDQPARCAAWMRYYWFRWSDVAVPWGIALSAAAWWGSPAACRRPHWRRGLAGLAGCGVLITVVSQWSHLPAADQQALRMVFRDVPWQRAAHAQWREVCAWLAQHTPPDAVILTPRCQQSLRWYGGRAEVVNWKDVPQDAAGILEWWTRYQTVYAPQPAWSNLDSDADMAARITRLAHRFGAQYAVVLNRQTLQLPGEAAVPAAPIDSVTPAYEVCFSTDIFVVMTWPTAHGSPAPTIREAP